MAGIIHLHDPKHPTFLERSKKATTEKVVAEKVTEKPEVVKVPERKKETK